MPTVEELQLELADLKAGRTSHQHTPREQSVKPFRCTSPYCEDLGSSEPTTSPSGHEDPAKYIRSIDA